MGWTDWIGQGLSSAIFGKAASDQAASMSYLDKVKYLYSHGVTKKPSGGSVPSIPYYLARADSALAPYTGGGAMTYGGDNVTDLDTYPVHRHRRMNHMNIRAARRAVTRLRGALKLLHRIERTMPHRACKRQHAGGYFGRRRK